MTVMTDSYLRLLSRIADELHDATEGITYTELAEKLDVDKSLISRWMKGNSNMTLETLHNMAFHMGKRIDIKLVNRHSDDWEFLNEIEERE